MLASAWLAAACTTRVTTPTGGATLALSSFNNPFPGFGSSSSGSGSASSSSSSSGSGGSSTSGSSGGSSGGSSSGSACSLAPDQLLPAWAANYVPTTELYISPTGSDSNSGTSRAAALLTPTAAIAKLGPGVRLNFTAGTYSCAGLYIANQAGGTAAPISIRSVDGPLAAKFNCAAGAGMTLDTVQGFILEGVELYNTETGNHGIVFYSNGGANPPIPAGKMTSDLVFHNSSIHDVGLACIKGAQSQNVTVIGNTFYNAPTDRMNVEMVAVDNVTLAGNEAYGSGFFDEIKGGAQGGIIYRNYVHDSLGGIMVGGAETGSQFLVHADATYEAENLQVWDNVITNENVASFDVWGCLNCTIANNSYYSPSNAVLATAGYTSYALRILADNFEAPGGALTPVDNKNLTIVNNLFMNGTSWGYMVNGTVPDGTLTMTNNAWIQSSGGYSSTSGVYSDIPFANLAASLYAGNPMLTSVPANLRPGAGSPLVGAGMSVPFVTNNADGTCWTGSPNIGAY